MSGKVSDLPIRYKRAVFTQKKLDRINFRWVCVVEIYEIHQVSPLVSGCHALLVMCMVTWFSVTWYWQDGRPSNVVDIRCSAVNVCPSRCDIYARSAMVSMLPPGIDVRKLQRSHSEISRESRYPVYLAVFFSVYLSGLPIRFSVFTQTLSDLTLDRSTFMSDKLLCVNTALVTPIIHHFRHIQFLLLCFLHCPWFSTMHHYWSYNKPPWLANLFFDHTESQFFHPDCILCVIAAAQSQLSVNVLLDI